MSAKSSAALVALAPPAGATVPADAAEDAEGVDGMLEGPNISSKESPRPVAAGTAAAEGVDVGASAGAGAGAGAEGLGAPKTSSNSLMSLPRTGASRLAQESALLLGISLPP